MIRMFCCNKPSIKSQKFLRILRNIAKNFCDFIADFSELIRSRFLKKCLRFFVFLIFLSSKVYANQYTIPEEDYQKLEQFFEYLLHYSTIGYSLCGEKPMAIDTFPAISKLPAIYALPIFFKCPGYSILGNGWELWKRYNYLFPSNRFAFRFVEENNTLVFINIPATRKTIEKNIDLFRKFSNSNYSVDQFLEELCKPEDRDFAICYNTTLLGILLGFGRNNSLAFSNGSYIQKLEFFNTFEKNESLNEFLSPGFICINNGTNDKENNAIRKKFYKANRNLRTKFKKGNYFKTFVKLFCQ